MPVMNRYERQDMADPLDASASLIIGHTGNGPTSEAHARLLSCAPNAIRALVGEVRRLRARRDLRHA